MSEQKKPGFWGRLFGVEKPQPKSESQEAMERATEETRGEQEALEALQRERTADASHEDTPQTAAPEREPADDSGAAHETGGTADDPGAPDTRDAAPPEMQAEWIDAGHPNPPEHEPPTPQDVTDPLEHPDAIEDEITADPEASADEAEPLPAEPEVAEPARPKNWFQRLSSGLKRSSDNLSSSIGAIFTKRKLDEAMLQDLEDTLIAADLGIDTAIAITDTLRAEKFDKDISTEDVRAVLAHEVETVLGPVATPLAIESGKKPFVILMVGVNGSGKTTTIGKLTAKYKAEGKSVLLAAGDTFRAAAVEQLQVWGQRNAVEVVTRPTGADAAGLAFDAVARAEEAGTDIVIIDTAGRLQNRTELMDELEKIIRVIKKRVPDAPHATLLTLDATTGQNALNQVEIFGQKAGVTGLVMTKLDGTARGGILVAIARKFGLPIHFIGVGESIGDLEPFRAADFARAIAGKES